MPTVNDPTAAIIQGILQLLGQSTGQTGSGSSSGTTNTNQTGNTNQTSTGTQDTTSTSTTNQTGTNTQNTAGTSSQQQTTAGSGSSATTSNQAISGSNKQTSEQTGSTSNITKTTGDIAGLLDVFNQQRQGISPDQLAAIFKEGSRAVPGLAAATANAVGARTVNNDPLATVLGDLQARLSVEAANLNRQMLGDASNTAGRIADATKTQETTGTSTVAGSSNSVNEQLVSLLSNVLTNNNQSVNTTGATNQTTTGTQDVTGTTTNTGSTTNTNNTNTNTNQTGTTNTNQNNTSNANTNQGINQQQTLGLLATLLGVSGFNNAGGVSGIADAIGKLFGGNSSDLAAIFGNGGFDLASIFNGDVGSGIGGDSILTGGANPLDITSILGGNGAQAVNDIFDQVTSSVNSDQYVSEDPTGEFVWP